MAAVFAALLVACSTPSVPPSSPATASIRAAVCQPTTTRDPTGVITTDGKIGVVGETFSPAGDGSFLVLRRGAKIGDSVSLQFTQLGTTAPATWVQYSVPASPQPARTPWGDHVAFPAGWKPIAFAGSCWRMIADGSDTGIVLGVGP